MNLNPATPNPGNTALVVMFKRPRLGRGKQRLATDIGIESARTVAEGLLACAIEDAAQWPGPVVLAPADEDNADWAQRLLPYAQVVPQPSGNLGERLQSVDQQLRNAGLTRLIYIGSDAPNLNPEHISEASERLNDFDCVFCPARDGGVTLMASRKPWPDLRTLPWSTGQLGSTLKTLCRDQNMTTTEMPPSYDIDNRKDLLRLVSDLDADPRPARNQLRELIRELQP